MATWKRTALLSSPTLILLCLSQLQSSLVGCFQYGGGSHYMKKMYGPINAAVKSNYNLEVRNIPIENEPIPMQKIDIESNTLPLVLHFKTASSKLKIMQTHQNSPGETKKSSSEDEPNVLIHEVRKPIYQSVREIIVPYRRTVQEVRPVQEQVETIIAKGERSYKEKPQPYYPPPPPPYKYQQQNELYNKDQQTSKSASESNQPSASSPSSSDDSKFLQRRDGVLHDTSNTDVSSSFSLKSFPSTTTTSTSSRPVNLDDVFKAKKIIAKISQDHSMRSVDDFSSTYDIETFTPAASSLHKSHTISIDQHQLEQKQKRAQSKNKFRETSFPTSKLLKASKELEEEEDEE